MSEYVKGPSINWAMKYAGQSERVNANLKNAFSPSIAPPSGMGGIKCSPKNLSFTSKHAITTEIAKYVLPAGEGGATGSQTLKALIYSPSNRLRGEIRAVFEPDNQGAPDPSFNRTPTWFIRAMSRNPQTGREMALQQAYPTTGTKNLPDAYEFDSAAQLLRAEFTLQDDNFAAAFVPNTERAKFLLICTWEPNVEMSNEEFFGLTAQCSVSFGPPKLIANNAV